jgi:hypothetical protein
MTSLKLRTSANLELLTDDICRLLTEAVCTSFSMFEHMEVHRITRLRGGKFRLDLRPNWAARQRLAAVEKGKEAQAS